MGFSPYGLFLSYCDGSVPDNCEIVDISVVITANLPNLHGFRVI